MSSDRRRIIVALAEAAITLAVLWWADPERPPLKPRLWWASMHASYATARTLAYAHHLAGATGSACERRYWKAVRP